MVADSKTYHVASSRECWDFSECDAEILVPCPAVAPWLCLCNQESVRLGFVAGPPKFFAFLADCLRLCEQLLPFAFHSFLCGSALVVRFRVLMSNEAYLDRAGIFVQEFHLRQISIKLLEAPHDQIFFKGRKERIEHRRYEFSPRNQMPLRVAKERSQFVQVGSIRQHHH